MSMKLINPTSVGDGSHTRSTTATYVNASGVVATAAINELRFNYNPATLAFEGALVELGATNYALQSAAVNSSSWTKSGTTVPGIDAIAAPDGTTSADKMADTAATSSHYASQTMAGIQAGTQLVFSSFVYVAERPFVFLAAYDASATGNNFIVKFNLTTLTTTSTTLAGTASNATYGIQQYPGGWVRIWVAGVPAVGSVNSTQVRFGYMLTSNGSTSYLGDGTSGSYFWGMQVEAGTRPTSLIPTTTATVARAADVLTGGLIYSSIAENDFAAWSAATTYALGAQVISTATHKIYKSLQAGNLNKDPTSAANSAWWEVVSSTNRWKLFDPSTGSQTTAATQFTVVINPQAVVNTVAFLNTAAANVKVSLCDPTDGLVYNNVIYTAIASLVGSWDSYLFDYVKAKTNFYVEDLPSYANAVLTLQFNNTGNASCGVASFGRSVVLGDPQYGSRFGIIDYSQKTADASGGYSLASGSYSKKAEFNLMVDNTILDTVSQLLTDFRATPATWIGTSQYQGTFIYGFLRDWSVALTMPTASLCSITIEGLS